MAAKTVSILGCGWLGLPFGAHLAGRGYRVKGSTTTPEKLDGIAAAGIEPFLLRLNPDLEGERLASFFDADILFLNIPPGRRRSDVAQRFPQEVEAVRRALHAAPVGYVLFASSTSVYPDLNRTVTEEDAGTGGSASGRALLVAEERLLQDPAFRTTVVRFAGLYGYSRRPGRFLAEKRDLENGDAPVNLIHRDDCIAILTAIIEQEVWGEVLNAVSDAHPSRRTFYTHAAEQLGLPPPSFLDRGETAYKVVSNARLKERLQYRFRFPSPLDEAP